MEDRSGDDGATDKVSGPGKTEEVKSEVERQEGTRIENASELPPPENQEQDMDIEADQRVFEANKRVKVNL